MPQRLVCFVVRMVKNNDQALKSIQGKPKQITLERTWQYGIHSQTRREQLFDRGLSRIRLRGQPAEIGTENRASTGGVETEATRKVAAGAGGVVGKGGPTPRSR